MTSYSLSLSLSLSLYSYRHRSSDLVQSKEGGTDCAWMDPSSAQHNQQEMASQTLERMLVSTKGQQDNQKKPRPQPEQALKCPRCDSTNTKFCYYNNYSLSQPRYFCKSCRRYWTRGGTLRNVPVGGGCRKSKRSSSSSSNSRRTAQDHQSLITTTNPNPLIPSLPPLTYDHSTSDHHRLGIPFVRLHKQLPNGQLGFDHDHEPSMLGNPTGHFQSTPSFFDALKSGFLDSPHGFSNLYYGMGNGNLGGGGEEVGMPYEEVSVATMKQEMWNGREGDNRVLWGFPWQLGGGGGGSGGGGNGNLAAAGGGGSGDLDSGRDSCWNGIGSTWQGLLNSPLV